MERHTILVVVLHLDEDGFSDAAKVAGRPFITSHPNCRAITNLGRNPSDAMIRKIGNTALGDHGEACLSSPTSWGLPVFAVGTDFDGNYGILEIDHYNEMDRLWDALA